ncbi:NitT/TauT family transport system substrate-binding protein [Pelomonas saccharophila]|uniref:NitT/TauT family transport system substrate-binding protein n=1 Tax=Roseateles saccharophilus TaxID=304 RepID=A0ABU1YMP4_ROSSA|nr:NrtA/SsuA/CpmA family ABC transporter substrate-binding protein [Roseateles saccharophilus]MDR7270127.1 NitT/TauT family transport system substrate-binding protein [Roseateles saccharophilus]
MLFRLCKRWLPMLLATGLAGAAGAAPLTVAVSRSPHSLPVFVALAEGLFEAEGLTVKAIEAPSGRRCLKLMAEGRADLGTAAETAIVFESFERTDFSIVATFSSTSSDVELVARRSAGIKAAGDLVGKRVGVVKGTSAQYFLDTFLLNNNVDPKSITQVALQPEAALDAMTAGQVDAVAVFQPFAYAAAHSPQVDGVVLSETGNYKQTFNLVAQNGFLKARRGDVERFLRAMLRAHEFIRAQPRRAEAIFVSRLGVEPSFAAWSMQRTHAVLALEEGLLRTMQSQANWALREGYASGSKPADYRALVDAGPLRAVLPNAVGLAR